MGNRSVLLLGLLVTGCAIGEEPMQNSPATNRVLDHFAEGVRFGESFEAAAQHGTLVDSNLDESGSTMRLSLTDAKHGLSSVRLFGTGIPHGNAASSQVHGIVLFSRPESAQIALQGARADAAHMFGNPGEHGCIHYTTRSTSSATVWEDRAGGGILLLAPSIDSLPSDDAVTRLIVYPRGQKARDVMPDFRTTGCPD